MAMPEDKICSNSYARGSAPTIAARSTPEVEQAVVSLSADAHVTSGEDTWTSPGSREARHE